MILGRNSGYHKYTPEDLLIVMNQTVPYSRDARDPVRALLNVQVLDMMGFRPPEGGGGGSRLKDFGPGGRLQGVQSRFTRHHFRKFWRFFENFTKLMYTKRSKIAFQGHFERTRFCVQTFKNLKFHFVQPLPKELVRSYPGSCINGGIFDS